MADYKNLNPEQVREVLESKDLKSYDDLSLENINDLRTALNTDDNNFAENQKNRDSYDILEGLAKERIEGLSADELETMSSTELESLQSLINRYYSSNNGKFDGKAGSLMEKLESLRKNAENQNTDSQSPAQDENSSQADTVESTNPSSTDTGTAADSGNATNDTAQATEDDKTLKDVNNVPSYSFTDLQDFKEGTPEDEIHREDTKINKYNAVEVAKDLDRLLPSQLYTLRRALNAKASSQANAAGTKLDDHILSQADKYNKGEIFLTEMLEVYALHDLFTMVSENPHSEKAKENVEALKEAVNKSGTELVAFEEQYGIDKASLIDAKQVEENLAKLDDMPKDSVLFAKETRPENLQPATDYRDVVEILNGTEQNKYVPEISVLAGALQCKELNAEQKQKLLDLAKQRIAQTNRLEHKDFANFEFLLNETKQIDGVGNAKKAKMLDDARKQYKEQAPLKNQEFQDIYNVLNNLKIGGQLKAFGREYVEQNSKDSDIALFMDQIRRETEMYLANTKPNCTPEQFNQEYADRLRNGLVEVVYADQVAKGKISQQDFSKMFDTLALAAKEKRPIKLNQSSIIGWQAAKTSHIESANKVLGKQPGYAKPAQTLSDRIKTTNKNLSEKYGALYSLTKGALKSASWGAAYAVAGTTMGPVGIAAVATASFANQAWGFMKDFKKERQAAKDKGEKPQNLWQYIKNNKLRTAGLFLGAATAAISGGSLAGIDINTSVNVAKAGAGMLLAGSGAIHQASQAYKRTQGSKAKKTWAATKSFALSGASFVAGMLVGKSAAEWAGDTFSSHNTDTATSTLTSNINTANGANINDIDLNNLSTEQQHDVKMAFLRDPREVNDILGNKEWMSSKDLQEAWDNGTITLEQKSQILDFASKRFDDNGNFQDVEGLPSAAAMEAEAEEWTENHSSHQTTKFHNPMLNINESETIVHQDHNTIANQETLDKMNNGVVPIKETEIDRSETKQTDVEVKKIKVDDNGNAKIVSNVDGKRFVTHTDADNLSYDIKNDDIDKIKYRNDGSVSLRNEQGDKYTLNNSDLEKVRHDGQIYKPDENIQTPDMKEHNQGVYDNLQSIKDRAENVVREDLAAKETSVQEPTNNTPSQETKTPEQETKTPEQETKTPEQETKAPEQETKTPEQETKTPEQETKTPEQETKTPEQETKTPEQETKTPEQETKTPEQETKTPEQETKTPEQETKTPEQDILAQDKDYHVTKSNIMYSASIDEDGKLQVEQKAALGYIDDLQKAKIGVELRTNEDGSYSYGLGTAKNATMAQMMHESCMKDAYINHEILEDLNNREGSLTEAEVKLKELCEQKESQYAQKGLTFNEEGRPVLDEKYLSDFGKEARLENDASRAERNMEISNLSTKERLGGKTEISGNINGKEIEGVMNRDGEFTKLSIDGEKITGNDLKQYNQNAKIENKALYNIVSDEDKLAKYTPREDEEILKKYTMSSAEKISQLRGTAQQHNSPVTAGEKMTMNNNMMNINRDSIGRD